MAAKLDYTYAADALAAKAGVPPALVSALINAESAWNPNAVSKTGATGLGQFTNGTGRDYGLVGAGFDNRADPALNMTAIVKYLADLKNRWGTWVLSIAHYSGQLDDQGQPNFGPGYARYSAGQALLATISMLDGVAPPTIPGDGPTIIVESITGRDQTTGKPARFIASMGAAVALALIGGGIVTCCSPKAPAPQQIAAERPFCAPPQRVVWRDGGLHCDPPTLKGSSFYFESGPAGKLKVVER